MHRYASRGHAADTITVLRLKRAPQSRSKDIRRSFSPSPLSLSPCMRPFPAPGATRSRIARGTGRRHRRRGRRQTVARRRMACGNASRDRAAWPPACRKSTWRCAAGRKENGERGPARRSRRLRRGRRWRSSSLENSLSGLGRSITRCIRARADRRFAITVSQLLLR